MMKAVQIRRPGGNFEIVNREIPEPGPGEVRLRVEACGICHSDIVVAEGRWPQIHYPRVPGHEIVGVVDKLGAGVSGWALGQPAGVGWHGGHCFGCVACRRGDFVNCKHGEITGLTRDGGYAQFTVARHEALVRLPEGLDPTTAAPLLCAGLTTYNALRHSEARGGDLVAIQGIGGLGHLAIQFSRRMGYRTVAVSRSAEKEPDCRELGAELFVNSGILNAGETLAGMGGARAILATAPDSDAISSLARGLADDGRLIVLAAPEKPLKICPSLLISGRRSIQGWPSGTPRDAEEAVLFSLNNSVLARVETFPLEQTEKAYAIALSNRARYRVVLRMH